MFLLLFTLNFPFQLNRESQIKFGSDIIFQGGSSLKAQHKAFVFSLASTNFVYIFTQGDKALENQCLFKHDDFLALFPGVTGITRSFLNTKYLEDEHCEGRFIPDEQNDSVP